MTDTPKHQDPLRSALLPCPFCGGHDLALWDGFGTQADLFCNDCSCERNVQVVDLFEQQERPTFDNVTCRYPAAAIERVNKHLISEWNTRAALALPQTAAAPPLREALTNLVNEVSGVWSAFDHDIRGTISNTN